MDIPDNTDDDAIFVDVVSGAALVACATLKALSSVASDDEELELSQDLLDHAK